MRSNRLFEGIPTVRFDPTKRFVDLAKIAGKKFPNLLGKSGRLSRVNSVLKIYALALNKSKDVLGWLEVVSPNNEIHPDLLACIESLPTDGRTKQRHGDYKSELRSNLNHIILCVVEFHSGSKKAAHRSFVYSALPKTLKKVWPHLPRNRKTPLHEQHRRPITETGIHILECLLDLAKLYKVRDPKDLFVDYSSKFYALLKRKCPPHKWGAVISAYASVRKKMGYKKLRPAKRSFDIETLPTFSRQWNEFEEKALFGIDDDEALSERATAFNIKVGSIKRSSLKAYRRVIKSGLFYIIEHLKKSGSFNDDLSIIDLLKIEPVTREFSNGSKRVENVNVLVDVYRQVERNAVRIECGKRAKLDSVTFGNFINAVKAIAAYNDYFDYRQPFDEAYKNIKIDRKTAGQRAALKKKTLDRPWINAEIEGLGKKFYTIVKDGIFERRDGYPTKDSNENMRLCLFYVMLVALRYLGFRQQAIRNCTINKNIIFKKNGRILFHYDENEVKNEVEINIPLWKENDPQKDTHNIAYQAIRTYYTKVYPYIKANAAENLEDQFFVKMKNDGTFIRHQKDAEDSNADQREMAHVHFYQYFDTACRSHLHFEDRAAQLPTLMNPHFLRGLCADWLFYDCKVSLEKIADYLGDLEETIKKRYLAKSKVKDGGPAIAEAGEKQKARLRAENAFDDEQRIKQMKAAHKAELADKEERIREVSDEARRANERADRMDERNSYLEAKLEKKELETAELLKKIDDNQAEFFSILKSNGGTDNIPTPAA